jgi:NADH:quinone reductase (non-electrogenic)
MSVTFATLSGPLRNYCANFARQSAGTVFTQYTRHAVHLKLISALKPNADCSNFKHTRSITTTSISACAVLATDAVASSVSTTVASSTNLKLNATSQPCQPVTAATTSIPSASSVLFPELTAITEVSLPENIAGQPIPTESQRSDVKSRRPRIVVLGTGWAAYRMIKSIDVTKYDVFCISPRNHFIFTPLLASTTTGVLEFRAISEPIRTVPGISYLQAECTAADTENKTITCTGSYKGQDAILSYDYLMVACGAAPQVFNTPGVHEHAHFLRTLEDARSIRNRILECFERASNPFLSESERKRLLTFVVVGAGPTCLEFSGELHDFIVEDIAKWYPDLVRENVQIQVIEAAEQVLSSFGKSLSSYTMKLLKQRRMIKLRMKSSVKEVRALEVELNSGEHIPCGITIWSTGVKSTSFVDALPFPKHKDTGRLLVDKQMRIKGELDVFAAGDCAVIENNVLPCTAQVAQQQGKFLADMFNQFIGPEMTPKGSVCATRGVDFTYNHRGALAYLGRYKGIASVGDIEGTGIGAWLFWRSAYLTQLLSLRNMILVPMYWFKTWFFGRDISRF